MLRNSSKGSLKQSLASSPSLPCLPCAKEARCQAFTPLMPPPSKGRWHGVAATEGLSVQTDDLYTIQNDSTTIPHPLRGSPLCTRGPFLSVLCGMPQGSFHEPLHKGAFFFYISRELPCTREPLSFYIATVLFTGRNFFLFVSRTPPLLGGVFYLNPKTLT